MGEGYEWVKSVIEGKEPLTQLGWLLLALVGLKIVVTGLTLGSGNPGGSFAPAVFVGVMTGAAYGGFLQSHGYVGAAMPFAVMGMAALIAGALGAPITGIMIALGFGGSTSLETLLALMTAVTACMAVMQIQRNVTVYTLEFVRLGIDLDRARGADPLSLVPVKQVMRTTGYEELAAKMPVCAALERLKGSAARWFVVRREGGRFVGIVSLHEMRLAIAEEELAHLLVLEDITDGFQPRLRPEMSIKDALGSFDACDAEVLPVCDGGQADARLAGVLSRQDALNAYRECADSMT
jgi:CIC family chloride channel protein